jgi:hypothetical protein
MQPDGVAVEASGFFRTPSLLSAAQAVMVMPAMSRQRY